MKSSADHSIIQSKGTPNAAMISKTKKGRRTNEHPLIDNSPRVTAQAKLNADLFDGPVQRQGPAEDEELMQGKFSVQKQELPEEEELMQGKFAAQKQDIPEEEELMQSKFAAQKNSADNTGMPDKLQAKMESAFGTGFSDVKVHKNSGKATEVGAVAYTQGADVHFAPGQYDPGTSAGQKLLGHELAHVVQQREGLVQPTGSVGGLPLNDSPALEKEADVIGEKASG